MTLLSKCHTVRVLWHNEKTIINILVDEKGVLFGNLVASKNFENNEQTRETITELFIFRNIVLP